MTKHVRLENGKQEWLLKGGYNTRESFNPADWEENELFRFELYANGEFAPTYKFNMCSLATDGTSIVFTNGETPAATIEAEQTGDLTWTFKLFIDGQETLPELDYTIGNLSDLLGQIVGRISYAVCLEGEMAGKIVRINGLSGWNWFTNWVHNGEKARDYLYKKFALIKEDDDVVIALRKDLAPIESVGHMCYELGVLMCQLVEPHQDKDVELLTTLASSIGHHNLRRADLFEGFRSEWQNRAFLADVVDDHFEEILELIGVSFMQTSTAFTIVWFENDEKKETSAGIDCLETELIRLEDMGINTIR